MHSEANAIISASRRDMIGATLYLAGKDAVTGELIANASSCAMCKRMVINAGIKEVVVRNTHDTYTIIDVQQWIDNDETLTDELGY